MVAAGGPDAVAVYARRCYVGMADGGLPTEGRRLLVVRGRRRGRRRLEVACCRGAPPRQLERRGLTGLEAADPARLLVPDATGPQRMLLLAMAFTRERRDSILSMYVDETLRGPQPRCNGVAFFSLPGDRLFNNLNYLARRNFLTSLLIYRGKTRLAKFCILGTF